MPLGSLDLEFWPGISDRRFEGTILSISADKGFGFIQSPQLKDAFQNKDIFIHRTKMSNFQVGDVVSFGVDVFRDGKPQAKDLRPVSPQLPAVPAVGAGATTAAAPLDPTTLAQSITNLAAALTPVVNAAEQLRQAGGTSASQDLASKLVTMLQGTPTRPPATSQAATAVPTEPDETFKIEVPFELVGALVGKKGVTIQELEKKAGGGVHIQAAAHAQLAATGNHSGPPTLMTMG